MNKQKNDTVMRVMSTFVMMVYLLIVAAYLFFTPGFQYKHPSGITKAKPDIQFIYALIRTNRCMVNNKPTRITVKKYIIHAIPLKSFANRLPVFHTGNAGAFNHPADHKLAYLSNRVLRI